MYTKARRNTDGNSRSAKPFLERRRDTFLALFLILFLAFMCVSAYMAALLEIRPANLILQPQGCALLQRYGVHTDPFNSSGACQATVMFRSTFFSDVAYVDDEPIRLAHDQIIGITSFDGDTPWTSRQKRWGAVWIVVVVLAVAMVFLNELGSRRQA